MAAPSQVPALLELQGLA